MEMPRVLYDVLRFRPPGATITRMDPKALTELSKFLSFVLRHQPAPAEQGYTLAGHLHPGIVLAGPGLFRERLPCFVVGENVAVLPAFGSFTGLGMITPEPGERVFVVAEGEVVPVG